MEWPGAEFEPVVLNTARPGLHRGRLNSEHLARQQMYYPAYQDPNALLIPSGGPALGSVHRSASAAGGRRRPTQIVINNEFDGLSPMHSPDNRRHSHGHGYHYDDCDSDEPEFEHRHHHHHRRRSPSPYWDPEYDRKMKKLEDLEKKEQEEEARERYEEERILKEAKKAKKKKEEEDSKKKWIEEYHIKQREEKEKEEQKKKEADDEFKKRVKKTFAEAGYDEHSIEKILKKGEKDKHGKEKHKIMDLQRPTYLKVHRKHIDPLTLDEYELPWAWDTRDDNYILIQQWIPEADQQILFEHTRKLRERKQLKESTVEFRKERDKLMLVRSRSPGRARSRSRSYLFT